MLQITGLLHTENHILKSRIFNAQESRVIAQRITFISCAMYYYVYLLQSKKTNKFYVGYTSNLKKRLAQHNNGENQSTKSGRPYELVYFEGFKHKKDALIREKKLKHHGQGIRRLKERLINSIEK